MVFGFVEEIFILFFDCCFQLEQQSFSDQDIWLRGDWWSAKTLNWLSRGFDFYYFSSEGAYCVIVGVLLFNSCPGCLRVVD